jgi:hypothetical protein
MLRLSIEKGYINSGSHAMQVDIQGPNPNTHATSGSIFHLLQPADNDWHNGIGTRFWIYNQSKHPLSLSINFKEKFNEFWAVADSGVYYLLTEDGNFLQQEIDYGNLIIPAFYHGYVYIPFESFAVPSWNTAIGDEIMDLTNIDSISLAMNVTVAELQRFSIDDLAVLTNNNTLPPVLSGNNNISIPASGRHQEQYLAALPASVSSSSITQHWDIVDKENTLANIDKDGWLTISNEVAPAVITILHNYILDNQKVNTLYEVRFVDPNADVETTEESIVSDEVEAIKEENATYQQFSDNFDQWASENRAWFVVIAIFIILVLIASFSVIQNRLK